MVPWYGSLTFSERHACWSQAKGLHLVLIVITQLCHGIKVNKVSSIIKNCSKLGTRVELTRWWLSSQQFHRENPDFSAQLYLPQTTTRVISVLKSGKYNFMGLLQTPNPLPNDCHSKNENETSDNKNYDGDEKSGW